uniref:MADF domain-containing protein n=1 Tax=Meloidogyne javanica TaxID=6303 RepID=A0A915N9R1_MELJA
MTEQDKIISGLKTENVDLQADNLMSAAVLQLTKALHSVIMKKCHEEWMNNKQFDPFGRAMEQTKHFDHAIARNDFDAVEGYLVNNGRADVMLDFFKKLNLWNDARRLAKKHLPEMLQIVEDGYTQYVSTQAACTTSVFSSATTTEKAEDESFEMRLIKAVKSNEVMYNREKRTAISSQTSLDEHWRTIGTKLGKEPEVCKDKWYQLRKSFSKQLKNAKAGKASKWPYFEAMAWLTDHMMCSKYDDMEEDEEI